MLTRKTLLVAVLALSALVILSGCMAGSVMMPDRNVEISAAAAEEGINALLAGANTGRVEWTESQFSSVLTALLSSQPGMPITGVTAMFEPDAMYLNVGLDGSLGVDSLALKGSVAVGDDNMIHINLDEAGAGPFSADSNLVAFIGQRLTAALDHPALGTVVDVSMGSGTLNLSLQ